MPLGEKQILEAFEKNRPYLIDIEKLVQKLKFGLINISVTVHDSKVTGLTVQSFQKIRYEADKGGAMTRIGDDLPNPNLKIE